MEMRLPPRAAALLRRMTRARIGALAGFSAKQLSAAEREFSPAFYLAANPHLVAAGVTDPWRHFLTLGWREGRDPNPAFSVRRYLEQNRDVAEQGVNPFVHYVAFGRAEDRAAPAPVAPLPEIPWYMDLGARAKTRWKECPTDLKGAVSDFIEQGYVVLRHAVADETVAAAKRAFFAHKQKFAHLYEQFQDRNGLARRVTNLHMALDAIKDVYVANERALRVQDYLFGAPSMCYSGLLFEAGSEQPLHRDSPYFCTVPEYYYLGVWVALEPVDAGNGALEVVEGGHLLQEPDRFEIVGRFYEPDEAIAPFDMRLWDAYQEEVRRGCEASRRLRKIVAMEPGDTVIWHPHLPHGGSPIQDQRRSRLSVVNHVMPKGARIGGMDLFFRRGEAATDMDHCVDYRGRAFVKHANVGFLHAAEFPADELSL